MRQCINSLTFLMLIVLSSQETIPVITISPFNNLTSNTTSNNDSASGVVFNIAAYLQKAFNITNDFNSSQNNSQNSTNSASVGTTPINISSNNNIAFNPMASPMINTSSPMINTSSPMINNSSPMINTSSPMINNSSPTPNTSSTSSTTNTNSTGNISSNTTGNRSGSLNLASSNPQLMNPTNVGRNESMDSSGDVLVPVAKLIDIVQLLKQLPAKCILISSDWKCEGCENGYRLDKVNNLCVANLKNDTNNSITTNAINSTSTAINQSINTPNPNHQNHTNSGANGSSASKTSQANSFLINSGNIFNPISSQNISQLPKQSAIIDINCITANPSFSYSSAISSSNARCLQCFDKYYYNLTQELCIPCNPLCKAINPLNQCLSCYVGYDLSSGKCIISNNSNTNLPAYTAQQNKDPNCALYMNQSTSICKQCANKYYFNISGQICLEVDPSCKTWSINQGFCTSCYPGYSMPSNISLACKLTSTLSANNSSSTNGASVISSGSVSSGGSSASNFQDGVGSKLMSNSNCIKISSIDNVTCLSCVYRYYVIQGICLQISNLCKTFNETYGYCLSCYYGYVISNGQCIVPKALQLRIDPFCAIYNQSTGYCNQCIPYYYLLNSKCTIVSPFCDGYDPASGFCTACLPFYTLNAITGQCTYLTY